MNTDNSSRDAPRRLVSELVLGRLRSLSGLIMLCFVTTHLGNHALGIISIEAAESMRHLHEWLWLNPLGETLLIFAITIHFLLALRAIYRRSSFKMPPWEAIQIISGLAISLLLIGHIAAVQVAPAIRGFDIGYSYLLGALWADDWLRFKQPMLLIFAWMHALVGLHFWLRLKPWYRRSLPWLSLVAVILPLLATLGFVRAGLDMQKRFIYPAEFSDIFSQPLAASPQQQAQISAAIVYSPWLIILIILVTLASRALRLYLANRQPHFTIHHPETGKLRGLVGQSVLEVLREMSVPHASICGGRARCTTCRINIDRGLESVDPPKALEASALKRIGLKPTVRLACQIRPRADIWITPLLPPGIEINDHQIHQGISGKEQEVVAMFVDLRGFSSIAETRLPYDVVLILNQFLEYMTAALNATNGHLVQFTGDGLFALFGLQGNVQQACRDALACSIKMQQRLDDLNQRIGAELDTALKIGVGIHAGEAIVGPMGPPDARVISAIGDSVNIASRLETATKQLGCIAVISRATMVRAAIELDQDSLEHISVRGRQKTLAVYPVYETSALKLALSRG